MSREETVLYDLMMGGVRITDQRTNFDNKKLLFC